jgi:peptidoglycan/xylan/chitin deacetylase (PgdA/CDA1 family)
MRLAVTACAVVIALCLGVFGYLLSNPPVAPQRSVEPAAPVTPPPQAVVRQVAEASESQQTIAQRSEVPESPAATAAPEAPAARTQPGPPPAGPIAVAQAGPPSALVSATPPTAAAPAAGPACPGNPNALGVARVVEIDTTGGPGFGFEHFREHDFLRPGEVVLTFDDGPWPQRTMAVVDAMAAHCTKAIFFPIGKHATYEPGILKQVAAGGHAIGSHTWAHQDLSKRSFEEAKDEIEKGISAVAWAVGGPTAPYFRFPALRHPPEVVTYLGQRNIAIFSTDMDSFDFKMRRPEQVRQAVLAKLKKHGKGIVLMHDFQQATAGAASDLLRDLKAGGYKVVFMKPKDSIKTIASYDEEVRKSSSKLPTVSGRPTSTVVKTISE